MSIFGKIVDAIRALVGADYTQVELEAELTRRAKAASEPLDWKHSIVDLLKLVGIDSSLAHRKELAKELGYAGPLDGSAAMNIWLHRHVMQKLARDRGAV